MPMYCTVADVKKIVPKNINIGTSTLAKNINVTIDQVEFWIEETAGVIDSYISSFYRIPIIPYKEPDFSQNPVTFTERFPHPITLINARLTAANIYDRIIMAQQEPNISEWGSNQRSLAFDDLRQIQVGAVDLKGQRKTGMHFVRQELLDPARAPVKPEIQIHTRQPGD